MTNTQYNIVIIILIAIAYFQVRKLYLHKTSIGKRFIIDYFDQNFYIEEFLPREGIMTRTILVERTTMFVLTLKEEFTYRGIVVKELVLKERHPGHYIGDNNDVHVHISIPLLELNKKKYSSDELSHDSWGILNRI